MVVKYFHEEAEAIKEKLVETINKNWDMVVSVEEESYTIEKNPETDPAFKDFGKLGLKEIKITFAPDIDYAHFSYFFIFFGAYGLALEL